MGSAGGLSCAFPLSQGSDQAEVATGPYWSSVKGWQLLTGHCWAAERSEHS